MRTNKFIPLLLAIVIHLAPLCFVFFTGQGDSHNTNHAVTITTEKSSPLKGIDLNHFFIKKIPRSQNNLAQTIPSINHNTDNFDQNSGETLSATARSGSPTSGSNHHDENNKTTPEIQFITFKKPQYPPIAREKGFEGVVKIKIYYNQQGNIQKTEVIQTSGHKMLDEAVKQAASAWKLSVHSAGSFEKSFEFQLSN